MDLADFYSYFALYGFIIYGLFFFVQHRVSRNSSSSSMSQQAATSKKYFYILLANGGLTGLAVLIYVYGYLMHKTAIADMFYILFTLALFCLAVTLIVPDRGKKSKTVHQWAAHSMTFSLMPLTALLYVDSYGLLGRVNNAGSYGQAGGSIFVVLLIVIWTYRQSSSASSRQKIILQQLYFLTFLGALTMRAAMW